MEKQPKAAESRQGTMSRCPEKEWNFAGLEDWELVAATYYEYARESPSIVTELEKPAPSAGIPFSKWFNLPLRTELLQRMPFLLKAHQTGRQTFVEPWQAKREADRREVCASLVLPPLHYQKQTPREKRSLLRPFNRTDCLWQLGLQKTARPRIELNSETGSERLLVEIEWGEFTDDEILKSFRQWVRENRPSDPKTGKLLGKRNLRGRPLSDSRARRERLKSLTGVQAVRLMRVKAPQVKLDPETGTETLLMKIEWERCTDPAIIESFERWLKEPRPTDVKSGKRIGRRSDKGHDLREWRARLQRLGLLRLRHCHTTDETIQILCRTFPRKARLWSFIQPSELNREAKKAVDDFRALFHFLRSTAKPRCWRMKSP